MQAGEELEKVGYVPRIQNCLYQCSLEFCSLMQYQAFRTDDVNNKLLVKIFDMNIFKAKLLKVKIFEVKISKVKIFEVKI